MVRGPAGMRETLGETMVGGGGTEGNVASAFPVQLGTREPLGLRGLNLCPQSLHPAPQSPSPIPRPTPSALLLHAALGDPL